MFILLLFAFLAGAGTALSPCVLPVLPALLSAGGVGGKRRPLGVVIGLSVTFTVTIIGLATVVDGVGFSSNTLRIISVVVLLVFGLIMLSQKLSDRVEASLSRIARFGPKTKGSGFLSGLIVGGALGFVYTPCASPILAAVISVSAASGKAVLVAVFYSLGSAVVLLLLTLGGRKIFSKIRQAGRGDILQKSLGVIMILTSVIIITNLDVNFDQLIAEHIPNINITASLECSNTVTSKLYEITGHQTKFVPKNGSSSCGSSSNLKTAAKNATQASLIMDAQELPDLGKAPDFVGTEKWFNTPHNEPLTLAKLKGHVVLVDFWTYTCINCIRTLPYLEAWDKTYSKNGLTIIGVEAPEFPFEKNAGNVENAIQQFAIHYPVVQDNNMDTWNAYGNDVWPADYLIDANGNVRYTAFGEGDYSKTETAIRALLAEAGYSVGTMSHPQGAITPSYDTTPETYLGTDRAQGWFNAPRQGIYNYGRSVDEPLNSNKFAYSGIWDIGGQPATALHNAQIAVAFQAKHVYLVLSSADNKPRRIQVLLDGHVISNEDAGEDVHNGILTVTNQRLYSLVSLSSVQVHQLTLNFAPQITGYAFTFG